MPTLPLGPALPTAFEPLRSQSLGTRYPQLGDALDPDVMGPVLEAALLSSTGSTAAACGVPRADVSGDTCRLQYPLEIRDTTGETHHTLALAVMFEEADAASRYEQVVLGPVAEQWSGARRGQCGATAVVAPMAMAVSVFPVSGSLPTLVVATDHERMSAVLDDVVGGHATLEEIDLVRLRRTPRCVLRYQLGSTDHGVVYGKVGWPAGHGDIDRGLEELAARLGLHRRAGTVRVPVLLGVRRDLAMRFFGEVPGHRPDVTSALGEVVSGAARVAMAIHTSGVAVGAHRDLGEEVLRVRQVVDAIRADAPELARWLEGVVAEVATQLERSAAGEPMCAHGDFTLSQLLVSGHDVGVLDFDGLCQAEPALDLGRFASYLRLALAKAADVDRDAADVDGDAATDGLLRAYQELGGPAVSPDRVRLACLLSLVLMAVRSWQQLKTRRLELVCGVLEDMVSADARLRLRV